MGKVVAWVVLAAVVAVAQASCDPYDCKVRHCADLVSGSSLTTNGKDYTHCLNCDADGICETQLRDDQSNVFFDCTDGTGQDCTSAVVNAEFNYCSVQ